MRDSFFVCLYVGFGVGIEKKGPLRYPAADRAQGHKKDNVIDTGQTHGDDTYAYGTVSVRRGRAVVAVRARRAASRTSTRTLAGSTN